MSRTLDLLFIEMARFIIFWSVILTCIAQDIYAVTNTGGATTNQCVSEIRILLSTYIFVGANELWIISASKYKIPIYVLISALYLLSLRFNPLSLSFKTRI